MNIEILINKIEKKVKKPNKGLPQELFKYITRVTPMINVDLLIKNNKSEILLTWRKKGEKYKAGWHFPGGIIRFKEKMFQRVKIVAKTEIGSKISFNKKPVSINEIHLKQYNRSHFISLLFKARLLTSPKKSLKYVLGKPKPGQWMWHKKIPFNLIKPHLIYKKYFTK